MEGKIWVRLMSKKRNKKQSDIHQDNTEILREDSFENAGPEEVAEEYDWQDDARRLARRFPQIESNVYDLCIASLKIIDDISCEVRFTIPYDSNELNPQSISRIKDRIREWVRKIGDDLKNKAYIIGNLYDKNDIKMYSVQY